MITPKEKKERRRKRWRNVVSDARVYVFLLVGIFAKKVLDLKGQTVDFSGIRWDFVLYALLAAVLVQALMESRGDAAAKKKNIKIRAGHAILYGYTATDLLGELIGS